MNRRMTTIVGIAFAIAAIASILVYRIAGQQAQVRQMPSTTKIIVAARDLELGSVVKDTDLTTADWVGALPKNVVTKKDGVLGRGVVSQMYQGEPIVETRLAAVGAGGGLAAIIPPGMRACAVRVNEVVGVAGFV